MTRWSDQCKLSENCTRCRNGIMHPPFVGVYDDDERNYVLAQKPVCMARWASNGVGHLAGEICGREPDKSVAGIDLCQHHADRLSKWRYFEEPEERVREKTHRLREADREYEQAARESELHRERVDAARGRVYYVRRVSDGMIKIGTTNSFARRMNALRAEYGELQILLTHGGQRKHERAAHEEFARYRIARSEWFRPARVLLESIYDGRRSYLHGRDQPEGAISIGELKDLMLAAPKDRDLRWKAGECQWPPQDRAA